jgi:hypothetical protein
MRNVNAYEVFEVEKELGLVLHPDPMWGTTLLSSVVTGYSVLFTAALHRS